MLWVVVEFFVLVAWCVFIIVWIEVWVVGIDFVYGMWVDDVVVGGCGLYFCGVVGGFEIGYWVYVGWLCRGYVIAVVVGFIGVAF